MCHVYELTTILLNAMTSKEHSLENFVFTCVYFAVTIRNFVFYHNKVLFKLVGL